MVNGAWLMVSWSSMAGAPQTSLSHEPGTISNRLINHLMARVKFVLRPVAWKGETHARWRLALVGMLVKDVDC